MKIQGRFNLIYALYAIGVLFYTIELLGGYNHFNESFVYIIGFVLSLYWIGYVIIKDIASSNIITLRNLFNVFGFLYSNFFVNALINEDMAVDDYIGSAMLMSHLAIFSFNYFYLFTKRKQPTLIVRRTLNVKLFIYGLFFLLVLCIVAEYFIVIKVVGLNTYILASRADRTLMRADYSILTFYKHTIPMISAISLYLFLEYRKKTGMLIFILSFLLAIAHSVISVSRTEFLATILPVIYLFYRYKSISSKYIIALGIGGFVLFGIWKSLLQSSTGELVMQQDSEFSTWYKVCKNIMMTSGGTPFIYGKSYLVTVLNFIIPVTGIETLSTWYLRIYEPDVLAMGGGRGFPAVFEAYMNFGILGVIGVYGLYGHLAKKVNTKSELGLLVFLILIVSIHQLFRSEAYSFWKNMMWFRMYPMLLLYYFSTKKVKV